jgi:hypothetical protein
MPETKSFKVEVIADNSGKWCGNGMRFHTPEQAEEHARDLRSRWLAVREWRVVPSEDAPNQPHRKEVANAIE